MRDLLQLQNGKKGQAAMEFLMTYGWALLVVLVAIGALAFFGVLNPGQFLPDQCTFFAGVTCSNVLAKAGTTSALQFSIQNGLGYTMKTMAVSLVVISGGPVGLGFSVGCITGQDVSDGAARSCVYTASSALAKGDRLKITPTITWNDGVNSRSRTGSITATTE